VKEQNSVLTHSSENDYDADNKSIDDENSTHYHLRELNGVQKILLLFLQLQKFIVVNAVSDPRIQRYVFYMNTFIAWLRISGLPSCLIFMHVLGKETCSV
jgi:hypothetical protein